MLDKGQMQMQYMYVCTSKYFIMDQWNVYFNKKLYYCTGITQGTTMVEIPSTVYQYMYNTVHVSCSMHIASGLVALMLLYNVIYVHNINESMTNNDTLGWPKTNSAAANNNCLLTKTFTNCLPTKLCYNKKAMLREHKPPRSGGSGFRTLDSRIRSMIQIATKIVSLGPWAMPCPSKKIRQNPFTSLRVIRRTDRQTNRQTDRTKNITSFFGGGNKLCRYRGTTRRATNTKYRTWKNLK